MSTFEKSVLGALTILVLSLLGKPLTVADALVHQIASVATPASSDPVANSTSQAVPLTMSPATEKSLVDSIIRGIIGS